MAVSSAVSHPKLPGGLAAGVDRLDKESLPLSNYQNNINVTCHVHLVEELARISLLARMFQNSDELSVFDERDDLLKTDPSLS